MKIVLFVCLILAATALKGQTFSSEFLGMKNGVSALLSFDTPLFKSEKISFAQTGRFGIDYSGENTLVFMMSNFGYKWKPWFKSTAGALYLGADRLAPSLGFQLSSAKKNRFLLLFPTVTVQSTPQIWLISVAQFDKDLKKDKKGILGITSLQLFENGEHVVTAGILHLGVQKGKFQYGFASYLMFFGNQFDFEFNPGVYLKYQFL